MWTRGNDANDNGLTINKLLGAYNPTLVKSKALYELQRMCGVSPPSALGRNLQKFAQ